MLSCWLVGVVLTGRVFLQPAGWAFLGLGTALAWSGLVDFYVDYALSQDAAAGHLAATLGDTSYVWWFVFLSLVLQLTPPVRSSSRWERWLPRVTVGAGVAYQVTALLRSSHLDQPHDDIVSPWALECVEPPDAGDLGGGDHRGRVVPGRLGGRAGPRVAAYAG